MVWAVVQPGGGDEDEVFEGEEEDGVVDVEVGDGDELKGGRWRRG